MLYVILKVFKSVIILYEDCCTGVIGEVIISKKRAVRRVTPFLKPNFRLEKLVQNVLQIVVVWF